MDSEDDEYTLKEIDYFNIIKNEEKHIDNVLEIRTILLNYVFENSLDLCEYLDNDNISNYINWFETYGN